MVKYIYSVMVNFTRRISMRVGNKKRKLPWTNLLDIALEIQGNAVQQENE